MNIYLATDHAGFGLKKEIKAFLKQEGYTVKDMGAEMFDAQDDYPDLIAKAAIAVSQNPQDKAIIFGGSGQGEAIVANRFPNVRAAVYNTENLELVSLTREHNDANILSIGARFVSEKNAKEAVKLFLETPFSSDDRHVRRIEKINNLHV